MNKNDKMFQKNDYGFTPEESQNLISESLKQSIKLNPSKLEEIQREISLSEEMTGSNLYKDYLKQYETPDSKLTNANLKSPVEENLPGIDFENILLSLYNIRDSLINMFKIVGINHEISDEMVNQILEIEKCISMSGGEIETFIPEDFVSGLENPNLEENANNVISTTKRCYKLGSVEDCSVEDNGNTIKLTFKGKSHNGIAYAAYGIVKAIKSGWSGSEAIDYIYKSDGGKMIVRCFFDGKWNNCSEKYNIKWELQEYPREFNQEHNDVNTSEQEFLDVKKSLVTNLQNQNMENDSDEIDFDDFEINTKN